MPSPLFSSLAPNISPQIPSFPLSLQVMRNGSQSMHAVSDAGVSVSSAAGDEELHIRTLDAPLVSPGHPTVLPQGRHSPHMRQGVHFNLVNNLWGTNYVSCCC